MTEDQVASAEQSPEAPPTAAGSVDGVQASILRTLADRVGAGESGPSDAEVVAALRRAADELDHCRQQTESALASALRWKERAVASWADNSRGAAADRAELVDLRDHAHKLSIELSAIQQTLSWRVTAPLRGVRRLRPGGAR